VQVSDGRIVGQFPSGATKEGFGLVFAKGNTLVGCVNKALDRLWANKTIKNLQRIWLAKATGAPVLK
jgi:polar amino acid transport system substrate-binding protein